MLIVQYMYKRPHYPSFGFALQMKPKPFLEAVGIVVDTTPCQDHAMAATTQSIAYSSLSQELFFTPQSLYLKL